MTTYKIMMNILLSQKSTMKFEQILPNLFQTTLSTVITYEKACDVVYFPMCFSFFKSNLKQNMGKSV